MKISCIYQIKNKVNGKFYIGSTHDYKTRQYMHVLELKANRHRNRHLQGAWNKYSEDSFEFIILEKINLSNGLTPDSIRSLLEEREQFYLNTLLFANCNDGRFKEMGYNILPNACSAGLGVKCSDQAKKNISESKKGSKNPNWGKPRSDEWRAKMEAINWNKGHPGLSVPQTPERIEAARQRWTQNNPSKNRDMKGENGNTAKLTNEQVREIKLDLKNGIKVIVLARKYGLNRNTIGRIKSGKTWTHITI
jgi:group I intron endonuclease